MDLEQTHETYKFVTFCFEVLHVFPKASHAFNFKASLLFVASMEWI